MASPSLGIRILPEPERNVAAGDITDSYIAIGLPLAHPAVVIRFYNATNATVSYSINGSTPFLSLAAGDTFTLNAQANKGLAAALSFAQGTQFSVISTTDTPPTTGFAFVSAFYASTNNIF